jgi:predicted metalloprotease with PDZ domain
MIQKNLIWVIITTTTIMEMIMRSNDNNDLSFDSIMKKVWNIKFMKVMIYS